MKMLITFRRVKDGLFEIPGLPSRYNLIMIPLDSGIYSSEGKMQEGVLETHLFVNIAGELQMIYLPDDDYILDKETFGSKIGDTYLFAKNINEGELEDGDPVQYIYLMFPPGPERDTVFCSKVLSIAFENDFVIYTYEDPLGNYKIHKTSYLILSYLLGGGELTKEDIVLFFIDIYSKDLYEEGGLGMRSFSIPSASKSNFKINLDSLPNIYQRYLDVKNENKNSSDYNDEDIIE